MLQAVSRLFTQLSELSFLVFFADQTVLKVLNFLSSCLFEVVLRVTFLIGRGLIHEGKPRLSEAIDELTDGLEISGVCLLRLADSFDVLHNEFFSFLLLALELESLLVIELHVYSFASSFGMCKERT
jgi:hypothetical protein